MSSSNPGFGYGQVNSSYKPYERSVPFNMSLPLHVFVIYTIPWPGLAESSVNLVSKLFFRIQLTDIKLFIRSGKNSTYSMTTLILTPSTVSAALIEPTLDALTLVSSPISTMLFDH